MKFPLYFKFKEEMEEGFKLPNETIIVKHIPKKIGMAANVEKGHIIEGGMLTGACIKYCVPLQRNKSLKNILTDKEKEFLEKETKLNLSIYSDYWKDCYVPLYKQSELNRFDLNNPVDYIYYKILLNQPNEIAHSWEDRFKKQTYKFVITREGEEKLEDKKKFDAKKEAFKLYGKIEDNKEQLIGVLKLLSNKPISKETKLDWIQSNVEEIIDLTPEKFISVVKDISLHTKLLINKAIDAGVIVKKGTKYSTADGLELCNPGEIPTYENVVRYLQDPLHQDVLTIIEAKVEKK